MTDDIQKPQNDLQSKLDNTVLPEDVIEEISNKEQNKTLRGIILETFGLGAVQKIFDTAERIEEATQEHKKGLLMQAYMEQTDNVQEEVNKLQKFVTNPEGNILFNKITRILSDNPENPYYAKLLSNCLKKTVKSDFQKLFIKHNYALNQIEKLTPQALILLADYKSWPEYKIRNYASDHGRITTNWIDEFLPEYVLVKGSIDDEIKKRIGHSLKDLLRDGIIKSRLKNENDSKDLSSIKESTENPALCEPTELGKEILEYIE